MDFLKRLWLLALLFPLGGRASSSCCPGSFFFTTPDCPSCCGTGTNGVFYVGTGPVYALQGTGGCDALCTAGCEVCIAANLIVAADCCDTVETFTNHVCCNNNGCCGGCADCT